MRLPHRDTLLTTHFLNKQIITVRIPVIITNVLVYLIKKGD